MNTLQFQLKGEVGTGRNCYTLLIELNYPIQSMMYL